MLTDKSTSRALLFGNISYTKQYIFLRLKIKLRIGIDTFGSVEKYLPDGYLKFLNIKPYSILVVPSIAYCILMESLN